MASPSTPSVLISGRHFSNLLSIIREANIYYARVADIMRHSIKFTHHARMHAQKLGLRIDIQRAINCPQRVVSVLPLPILDTSVSPTALAPRGRQPTVPCRLATSPMDFASPRSRRGIVLSPLYISPVSRRVPADRTLVSRFSVSPDTGVPAAGGESTDNLDMPAAPAVRPMNLPNVEVAEGDSYWDSDIDSSPVSWFDFDAEDVTDSYPTTPEDDGCKPIMIRIKRKSAAVEIEDEQCKRHRSTERTISPRRRV